MRLFILLAAAAAAERVNRDADGVPDAAPEGACCECCYGCNPVWKSKFYGAFVLNRRVHLHAIDATPARWVAMPVPHCPTEPARPRHRRDMTS